MHLSVISDHWSNVGETSINGQNCRLCISLLPTWAIAYKIVSTTLYSYSRFCPTHGDDATKGYLLSKVLFLFHSWFLFLPYLKLSGWLPKKWILDNGYYRKDFFWSLSFWSVIISFSYRQKWRGGIISCWINCLVYGTC